KLENLVSINHFPDLLKGLSQGTDYNFVTVSNLEQAESILKEEWNRVCEQMLKVSPHKEAVQIMLLPYDFHTLRQSMKAESFQADRIKELPEEMKKIRLDAETLNESNQIKEAFLDRKMYDSMVKLSQELDSDLITEQVQMKIDFYNIKTMLRAREMRKESSFFESCYVKGGRLSKEVFLNNYSVPFSAVASSFANKYCNTEIQKGLEGYESNHNFSDLEILLQNALINHMKKAKLISYGAEIIYAYLMAKENELRQIRLLLTCKLKNISNGILIRKLGESYV
ncbi:MAG TPA: V-type ATPase subunit, partial [Lachnospiraceae bacterium]|nr:V-type ATPase subunit [Lachnospiraceae bacterium]